MAKEICSYAAAHARVKSMFGSASSYECRNCGRVAHQWAYDHLDVNEIREVKGSTVLIYSGSPDRYLPLCRKCHKGFDASFREENPDRFTTHSVGAGTLYTPPITVDWKKVSRIEDVLPVDGELSITDFSTGEIRTFTTRTYPNVVPKRRNGKRSSVWTAEEIREHQRSPSEKRALSRGARLI